ncbi:MAG: preprotein translocase subunit SecG [Alysiella sp.]|uniref:preprotein translocase subunit SecG n=1 Tax=Alysiella sp. TaxID=1872483 RepID=UPI0026DB2835|nr:preprotein translocase subunit SecG [Alysiella sp.]MDO4434339.1 preprotein translocase subunit SecG [Alysiella sp.]
MEAFKTVIWIINVFSSLAIIILVLMQHGKGADAGASFGGSGSAQGVFGSAGNANFLSRMTSFSAIVFFASCLALGMIHSQSNKKTVDFSNIKQSHLSASAVATSKVEVIGASAVSSASEAGVSASSASLPK